VPLIKGAEPYSATWQDATRTITAALGRPADGAALVARTESEIGRIAAANPGFAKATFSYLTISGNQVFVSAADATSVRTIGSPTW